MSNFFTRPHFEDRQQVQYENDSITLSGITNASNTGKFVVKSTVLDFTGTTTGQTSVTVSGLNGFLNQGRISGLVIEPPKLAISGSTGYTTVDVTGYVLKAADSGGTVTWEPVVSADTNTYVTGGTLNINSELILNWNNGGSASPIDLSALGNTGSTLIPLIYNQSTTEPNDSIQPSFGTSTIDSGSTFSSILGGNSTEIINNSSYSSILGGNGIKIRSDFSTILGGVKQDIFSGSTYSLIGQGNGGVIRNSKYATILNGKGNKINPNPSAGYYGDINNTIIGGEENYITSFGTLDWSSTSRKSWNLIAGNYSTIGGYGYYTGNIILGGGDNYSATGHLIYGGGGRNTIIGGNGYAKNLPKNLFPVGTPAYAYFSGSSKYYSNIIIGAENAALINTYGSVIHGDGSSVSFGNIRWNTIIGGSYHSITGQGSSDNFIIGSRSNKILDSNECVAFGRVSEIESSTYSTIGGGRSNWITGSTHSTIVGGGGIGVNRNSIINSTHSIIGNGLTNTIETSNYSLVGSGAGNEINSSNLSSIVSGGANYVNGGSYNNVLGGKGNQITGSSYSSVIGGQNNFVVHSNSHIIGSNIISVAANTTHVEGLNIQTLSTGTSVSNLGIDASGNVVTGVDTNDLQTVDPYFDGGSSTSITWDVSGNSTNYEITITGNTTLDLINVRDGEYGTIWVEQGNSSGNTLTFGTINGAAGTHIVANGGGGSPTLTTGTGNIDILTFTYNGNSNKMAWTTGNDYT